MSLPFREGDVFSVPLPTGGWAAGVVVRTTGRGGVLVGYFYGPRRLAPQVGRPEETVNLKSLLLVARFGDLGLIRGEWPISGPIPGWNRMSWPVPAFSSRDPLSGTWWRNEYADDNPNQLIARDELSETDARNLPVDGVHGAGAVAKMLDRLLPPTGIHDRPGGW